MKNLVCKSYNTIIFDLGAVLIDWNPRYLFNKIFPTPDETEYFLEHVCTSAWNEEQDAGRSLQDATEMLISAYPHYEAPIRAYYGRWKEMLGGPIDDSIEILQQLKATGQYRLYALTNWSNETFPIALMQYPFLQWFDGIVVSGREKQRKPHASFYQLLLDRYDINAAEALFIDDNLRNVTAAQDHGIDSIHFISPEQLKYALQTIDIQC
jgi:2-haloacid dehalogenase